MNVWTDPSFKLMCNGMPLSLNHQTKEESNGDVEKEGNRRRSQVWAKLRALNGHMLIFDKFRRGLEVKFEHGTRDPETNVTTESMT